MGKSKKPSNAVVEAIERLGGPVKASCIAGVSNATMYAWRDAGRVHRAVPAVLLARASGVSLERLIGLPEPTGTDDRAA